MKCRMGSVVLVLLAIQGSASAQIIIAPNYRVQNVNVGCCGPATIEAVAAHQGYHQAQGLVVAHRGLPHGPVQHDPVCGPYRNHPCNMHQSGAEALLRQRGIPFQSRPVGSYDPSLIHTGLSTNRPVIVTTRGETRCGRGHFYAVVGKRPGEMLLYDSNQSARPYIAMPEEKFQRVWLGGSVLIGR